MAKKKVGLSSGKPARPGRAALDPGRSSSAAAAAPPAETETLELFFNTGIIYQPLDLPERLPDTIVGFIVDKSEGAKTWSFRKAGPADDPDVEVSVHEHLGALTNRWLPVPYQLSATHCVQVFLGQTARGGLRAMLAIDTLEVPNNEGRFLDRKLDAGRPYQPLGQDELGGFLEHAETQELCRKLEREGVERAPFVLCALLERIRPFLPKLRLLSIDTLSPVGVSLVLDLGNSRSTAVLVEAREEDLFCIPLELRHGHNPFEVSDEPFDSRCTFVPSAFESEMFDVAVGEGFVVPSLTRLGREALDRALETPHRYLCSLSGPKRYLWDDELTDDRWHFAHKKHEYRPIFGRMLKFLVDEAGGVALRRDGPSTPADPRYAPRTMMLFAIAEIVSQAMSQINSVPYRRFQGKEGRPRVLEHVVLTHPSGMPAEEREVYERLVQNAVTLVSYLFNVEAERRPNATADGQYTPFLFADEALAAQMVFVYEEVAHRYQGSFEGFAAVYGREGKVRVASVDIGGGTTDVMIADYGDQLAGSATSLTIDKKFQDGVSIAGDEVCRAIVEDIVFPQLLGQLESHDARAKLVHLFAEGDAGFGASWRTLKAKSVPYLWVPLARAYWALAEGFEIPEHSPDKHYGVDEVFEIFGGQPSSVVLSELDQFIGQAVPGFPGVRNLFFRFDRGEVERSIERVLREPLRRYADILAQFDIDLLVLAGRTSALKCIHRLFLDEMPVSPPRIKMMSHYRVSDWYPSKWRHNGFIKDPKSTVTAGATVLHLAHKNQIAGFLLDSITAPDPAPIYGLYQEREPNIAHDDELFGEDDKTSRPIFYTNGMLIGFRNVASQEMDGSPLYEVRPARDDVAARLAEERVSLIFGLDDDRGLVVKKVESQRGAAPFEPEDFHLKLRTTTGKRYWLDTGVFKNLRRYV